MKFRIIAVTLFAMSLTPPAMAEAEFDTIGSMRDSCRVHILNTDESRSGYLQMGLCFGWIIAERSNRNAACILLKDPDQRKRLGQLSKQVARDLYEHSVSALIQAFVNWADDHPHLWQEKLTFMPFQDEFWAEFPCEPTN